jgi:tetratricopeptide (TPR) repeat protein
MPQTADALFHAAHELQHRGDYAGALQSYKEAIRLDGQDPRFHISLGTCLLALRHWPEAVKALKRGLDLKPHYAEADARLWLAEAYEGNGEKKKAEEQLKTVAAMSPSYPSYDAPINEAKQKLKTLGCRD